MRRLGGTQKLQRNIRKVNHGQQTWSKSPPIRSDGSDGKTTQDEIHNYMPFNISRVIKKDNKSKRAEHWLERENTKLVSANV